MVKSIYICSHRNDMQRCISFGFPKLGSFLVLKNFSSLLYIIKNKFVHFIKCIYIIYILLCFMFLTNKEVHGFPKYYWRLIKVFYTCLRIKTVNNFVKIPIENFYFAKLIRGNCCLNTHMHTIKRTSKVIKNLSSF